MKLLKGLMIVSLLTVSFPAADAEAWEFRFLDKFSSQRKAERPEILAETPPTAAVEERVSDQTVLEQSLSDLKRGPAVMPRDDSNYDKPSLPQPAPCPSGEPNTNSFFAVEPVVQAATVGAYFLWGNVEAASTIDPSLPKARYLLVDADLQSMDLLEEIRGGFILSKPKEVTCPASATFMYQFKSVSTKPRSYPTSLIALPLKKASEGRCTYVFTIGSSEWKEIFKPAQVSLEEPVPQQGSPSLQIVVELCASNRSGFFGDQKFEVSAAQIDDLAESVGRDAMVTALPMAKWSGFAPVN